MSIGYVNRVCQWGVLELYQHQSGGYDRITLVGGSYAASEVVGSIGYVNRVCQ